MNDFRLHAPHLGVSLVLPGHVGTGIIENSGTFGGEYNPYWKRHQQHLVVQRRLDELRQRGDPLVAALDQNGALAALEKEIAISNEEHYRRYHKKSGDGFRKDGPTTAKDAACMILDGVQRGQWRILVGEDAVELDKLVRHKPVEIYDDPFLVQKLFDSFRRAATASKL